MNKFIKINIRGDEVDVFKYIGKQIPLIDSLIDCNESSGVVSEEKE